MSAVPSQILYLEHGSYRLYAEAIQIVSARSLCWARPTLLISGLPEGQGHTSRQAMIAAAAADPEQSNLQLYDLDGCPDIIWPMALFQIAFDIDFFSLLVQLKMQPKDIGQPNSSYHLHNFISSFWQAHADHIAFPASADELSS